MKQGSGPGSIRSTSRQGKVRIGWFRLLLAYGGPLLRCIWFDRQLRVEQSSLTATNDEVSERQNGVDQCRLPA